MNQFEETTQRLRMEWNSVGEEASLYIESLSDREMEQDFVWQHLGNVQYPWRIGIVEIIGPTSQTLAMFKWTPSHNRKFVAAMVSLMAQMLHRLEPRYAMIVLDQHNYGFAVRGLGGDDLNVQ